LKPRSTLKSYFIKGAIPKESDFADLIDSMLIQDEDAVFKTANDPLSIKATGAEEALLNCYRVEQGNNTLTWQVKQKPNGAKPGLSIGENAATRLFIESGSGNVGIGTSTPGARLEVAQGSGLAIRVEPNAGNSVYIGRGDTNSLEFDATFGTVLNSTANLSFNIDSNNDDANTRFVDFRTNGKGASGGASLLRVLENGNVGIGTASPTTRLQVNGAIYATGKMYCDTAIVVWWGNRWNANSSQGWYQETTPPSDARLKRDVQALPNALQKVLSLRGVAYKWNDLGLQRLTRYADTYDAGPDATEQEQQQLRAAKRQEAREKLSGVEIGMIAQEVRQIAPELVSEDEDGYLGIAYERVVALLIEAVKEQQATIQALSDKMLALQPA
jgi:Chaperone of endosialidase